MSRFPLFFKLTRFGVRDGIILLATFALTVVFDLTYGVLGGVAITFLLNIKNCKIGLKIDKQDSAESTTLSIRGALFFLNANKLVDAIAKELSSVNELTVDFTALQSIDETAMEKLKGIDKKAKSQGKTLQLINMNADMVAKFDKFYGVL